MTASNKVIAALLMVALVLAIGTTFLSLSKITNLTYPFEIITGAASASGTGYTNLTITSTTSLTNQNAQINFGSGRVNSTCSYCVMDSNGVNNSMYSNGSNFGNPDGRCCVGFSGAVLGFLLENTGNTNLSLGYTCAGNCTHVLFIGGTRGSGINAGLEIKATANSVAGQTGEEGGTDSAASCAGGGIIYRDVGFNLTNSTSYTNPTADGKYGGGVYAPLMNTGHWLCGNSTSYPFDFTNTQDAAVIDINVTIPGDAVGTSVQSSFTLTFNGTSSG